MKITLNRVNDNFHFELKNERGHLVNVDSRPEYGGNDMGASPMELVLMGVAGCSAIDMISILKNNVKKSRLSKLRLRKRTSWRSKTI
jgi:putative redox protein